MQGSVSGGLVAATLAGATDTAGRFMADAWINLDAVNAMYPMTAWRSKGSQEATGKNRSSVPVEASAVWGQPHSYAKGLDRTRMASSAGSR